MNQAGPFRRATGGSTGGVVDYRLARRQLIESVTSGETDRAEVCDAQTELRRVAHHHGKPLHEDCPLCDAGDLVTVSFAFGAGLPRSGRTVSTDGDLARIRRRKRPTTLYHVEVCRTCWWNFLREAAELPEAEAGG